jgi:hypothetical protein
MRTQSTSRISPRTRLFDIAANDDVAGESDAEFVVMAHKSAARRPENAKRRAEGGPDVREAENEDGPPLRQRRGLAQHCPRGRGLGRPKRRNAEELDRTRLEGEARHRPRMPSARTAQRRRSLASARTVVQREVPQSAEGILTHSRRRTSVEVIEVEGNAKERRRVENDLEESGA